MKKPLSIAIGIQAIIMLAVLVPPLVTLKTGTTVYLETRRVDPRDIFRGDYVTLDYDIGLNVDLSTAKQAYETGSPVYVVVTTDRPAAFVSVLMTKPELKDGQACIVARATDSVLWADANSRFPDQEEQFRTSYVRFPQISQFFVPEGTGHDIEQDINSMVAEISVTNGCSAVVRDLQLL